MSKYPRVTKSNLPKDCVLLFHRLMCIVESDFFNIGKNLSWEEVKKILNDITLFSSVKGRKIEIQEVIPNKTIYLDAPYPKGKNFANFLRHSFAHNSVSYDTGSKMISIILPVDEKSKKLKLNCKISKKTLSKIVEIYEQFYVKIEEK